MSELALVNLDKRQLINPCESEYGWKLIEVVFNGMTRDILWLFTVPVDGQEAPVYDKGVPVGSWAGDRVAIVDEYCGSVSEPGNLDEGEYKEADADVDFFEFVLKNFEHVQCPPYEHQGDKDALFPVDRVWVIRNLDKKWYVRSDVLIREEENRAGPYNKRGLGFGDLIFTVTCGAGDPMPHCSKDRFDVRPISEVGDDWVDKSTEALKGVLYFSGEHAGYGDDI